MYYNNNMAEKKKKKLVNLILSVVLFVVATFLVITIASTVYQTITLKKQAEVVNAELAKLEEEKEKLSSTKAKLEDENYVVTYARGEYMFSKGDEKLFKLPSKK